MILELPGSASGGSNEVLLAAGTSSSLWGTEAWDKHSFVCASWTSARRQEWTAEVVKGNEALQLLSTKCVASSAVHFSLSSLMTSSHTVTRADALFPLLLCIHSHTLSHTLLRAGDDDSPCLSYLLMLSHLASSVLQPQKFFFAQWQRSC